MSGAAAAAAGGALGAGCAGAGRGGGGGGAACWTAGLPLPHAASAVNAANAVAIERVARRTA